MGLAWLIDWDNKIGWLLHLIEWAWLPGYSTVAAPLFKCNNRMR
uniref:Uncharacterized protein n=2 Tax=Picea TaxID=3328 RepID=A0A101M240_PICGL|nr:hypothetical protein ABT39_MTgene4021 [Picea glauca]QHR89715.1 hypothetical protein Q903MT_gene3737 [Picea sitchensis]